MHFTWTKALLYWIVITAGTMAECVFLVASLWMSINASVHSFVLLFLSQDMTVHISEFANTAYVGLPECILGLAFVITLGHYRVWLQDKRQKSALTWAVLYTLPTVIFLGLSIITLAESVAYTTFILPTPLIVARAIAGYFFGFIAFLYSQLGVQQEADRLQEKDDLLAIARANIATMERENADHVQRLATQWERQNADLERETRRLNTVIEQQNLELQKHKRQNDELVNELNKSSENALQAYSEECQKWLKGDVKSVSVDDITAFTGHSKRKINNAIEAGKLATSTRNKGLVLVTSLIEWLQQNQPSTSKSEQETGPMLRVISGD